MSEVKSYKPYARIISVISGIIIIIAGLDASQVIQIFPEYASQINTILMICGILAPVIAQEKRVEVAEQLVHEEYADKDESDGVVVNLTLDGEDVVNTIDEEDPELEDDDGLGSAEIMSEYDDDGGA